MLPGWATVLTASAWETRVAAVRNPTPRGLRSKP
jgi:hypothetical protein